MTTEREKKLRELVVRYQKLLDDRRLWCWTAQEVFSDFKQILAIPETEGISEEQVRAALEYAAYSRPEGWLMKEDNLVDFLKALTKSAQGSKPNFYACPHCGIDMRTLPPEANAYPHTTGACKP